MVALEAGFASQGTLRSVTDEAVDRRHRYSAGNAQCRRDFWIEVRPDFDDNPSLAAVILPWAGMNPVKVDQGN